MKKVRLLISIFLAAAVLLSACGKSQPEVVQDNASATSEPEQQSIYTVWLAPYLPEAMLAGLDLPSDVIEVSDQNEADIVVDVGADYPVAQWVYVLVAPFGTVADGVTLDSLQALWEGTAPQDYPAEKLILDGSTQAVFEKLWGSAAVNTVDTVPADDLLSKAWSEEKTWAIITFEDLDPQWKVIAVDDDSPIQKAFNMDTYGLKVPFSLVGNADVVNPFMTQFGPQSAAPMLPSGNRDADKLTTVLVTGVTALVRGTAYLMEQNGMTYPAIDIGDVLRDADILHISNEIPFTETCPKPFANAQNDANLVFCSKPEYIQLLEAVGTDVVELTGDHFRDWGADAMLYTIDMYNQRGWQYYGGGTDLADGMQPALFEHNGNKIAFIGCNAKPPGYATASATSPGAVHCDMDAMAAVVKQVVADGYLPIFTFQHLEYYAYTINQNLVGDFEKAADAGAVIVSGSQAHQPHALEFYKGATLHYGLGNLFFDQYNEGFPQRQAFMDRHIFYDGRYINTELLTIMFTDNARPRFMTADERADLLQTVFAASGW
jgi:poly-gamma-glutamate synthesis protein (capsule biosynthesis protein)